MEAEATLPAAVAAAIAAYRQDGLSVEVLLESPGFARLSVTDPAQRLSAKVELGIEGPDLLRLAAEHDPGFDLSMFAAALHAIRRLPEAEFTAYGLTHDQVQALVGSLAEWADEIDGRA